MTITYQQENFTTCIPEIEPMVEGHWRDVTDMEWPLDVDWEKFKELDRVGIVRLITARADGKLIGYFVAILHPALHYKTKLLAHDDAFFLAHEYRGGLVGFKLFRAAEAALRKDGVDRIVVHEKLRKPVGKFLERLGYRAIERNWWLDLSTGQS